MANAIFFQKRQITSNKKFPIFLDLIPNIQVLSTYFEDNKVTVHLRLFTAFFRVCQYFSNFNRLFYF